MKPIIFLLLFPFAVQAQKDYAALLDQYMRAAAAVNQFSGSVLVAKSGRVIYQKTFGTADFASTHLLDANSMFEIGVLTEQFTAAAILLLEERGLLQLTDKLTSYFPELPYPHITIQHLLTHTSGLPDFYDILDKKWDTSHVATNTDMLQFFNAKPRLRFEPGRKYEYCATDFSILASIIEKVSGERYADFMQKNIFTPLHLDHTKVLAELQLQKKLHPDHTESVYYDEMAQAFFPADSMKQMPLDFHYATEGVVGDVGISSTAHDLLLWDRALKNHTLLTEAAQRKMFTPFVLKDTASKVFCGYGTLVGKMNWVIIYCNRNWETLFLATLQH